MIGTTGPSLEFPQLLSGCKRKKKKEKVRQDLTEAGEQLVVLLDCFSWHDGLAQQHKMEGDAKNSRNIP